MGQKQKIREAKKASGDLKVDKTTRAGYDRNNVAEVIKRLKQMAKEDTDRFDKMDLAETLERLEQSERVAATIGAAYDVEMARKRALLRCFVEHGITLPAPETRESAAGFNEGVLVNPSNATASVAAPAPTPTTAAEVSVDDAKRRSRTASSRPGGSCGGQRHEGAQRRDGEGVAGAGIGSARNGTGAD